MHNTQDSQPIDKNLTYAIAGVLIYRPSKRWIESGVLPGDFLASTTETGDVNSPEKIVQALKAPSGTSLLIVRNNQRMTIVLN